MQNQTSIRIAKLFSFIILVALPSLVFSQSLNLDKNAGIEFSQPDPFANYMLRTDNPCNNSRFLELQNMSGDEMLEQESALFKKQTQKCRDYISAIEDSKPEESIKVSNEDHNPLGPYFIVGACATVIAVGIVIIV